MRIKIKSDERNFNLWLPTRLFLNPVSAAIAVKAVRNKNFDGLQNELDNELDGFFIESGEVTYSAMLELFDAIKKSRRILDGQPFVSVNSADGEVVDIWL